MTDSNLVSIQPGRSDALMAEEIRSELTAALGVVIEVMDRANLAGLQVSWSIGRDQFGRNTIQMIQIVKPL